jgi:hypothetical protein
VRNGRLAHVVEPPHLPNSAHGSLAQAACFTAANLTARYTRLFRVHVAFTWSLLSNPRRLYYDSALSSRQWIYWIVSSDSRKAESDGPKPKTRYPTYTNTSPVCPRRDALYSQGALKLLLNSVLKRNASHVSCSLLCTDCVPMPLAHSIMRTGDMFVTARRTTCHDSMFRPESKSWR